MRVITLVLISLFTFSALAAGDSAGGVPYGFIKLQLINFVVFAFLIALIVKLKVNPILADQKQEYLDKANEAARKLKESKDERDELKRKLADLEESFEKNLAEAKQNSEQKYKSQISLAKESTQRINKDLEHQIKTMKHVYWSRLKENLFESSVAELKKEVEENIDPIAVEKLQKSFVDRMDVRI